VEGEEGGREMDAVSWEIVEKESRRESMDSARGEVWAFIWSREEEGRRKGRVVSCKKGMGIHIRGARSARRKERANLLNRIWSSYQFMMVIVDERMPFGIEPLDLCSIKGRAVSESALGRKLCNRDVTIERSDVRVCRSFSVLISSFRLELASSLA
jgi:hypothetical protein